MTQSVTSYLGLHCTSKYGVDFLVSSHKRILKCLRETSKHDHLFLMLYAFINRKIVKIRVISFKQGKFIEILSPEKGLFYTCTKNVQNLTNGY